MEVMRKMETYGLKSSDDQPKGAAANVNKSCVILNNHQG